MSQNSQRLLVPSSLSLESLIQFCEQLAKLPELDLYEFDFSKLSWTPPFGMLFLSEAIRRYRAERPGARFRALNFDEKGYPAYMGFFQAFGLDFGNEPGAAQGSSRYLPLRRLQFSDFEEDAALKGGAPQDAVERHANELANVLSQQTSGPLADTLSYALREILRNSLEHSGAAEVGYCAQYWPSQQKVEIAILDSGVGMLESLSRNPHLEVNSHSDALNHGLLPGVSGSFYEGVRVRYDDDWQNSGFGLYMTSRLCGSGGSFLIMSGDAALLLKPDKNGLSVPFFQGTAIRATLKTHQMAPLARRLEQYRKEGESIAAGLGKTDRLTASMASRMLSRDFKSKKPK